MASTHKHLRSSTANKRPTTSIAEGQIALNTNTTSPGLFFKDSTGATIIKVGPVHVGTTAPNATPPAGGSSGNSTGEVWLDTSLTPNGVKIWNGSAWVNATPVGSTTVQGLLELATDAETQAGSDTARAVTPASLQSKMSDSATTTSATTIASSTAVKTAYDLANAALPRSGGTVTGNLEIGTTGSLSFEGSTADGFETTIAVTDPTADRTITLPDTTGTVVTTGDTGTVTSAMIANGTIVDADINASAAIAHSKLANITAGQVLLGNASNVPTATALSGDVTVNSSGVTAISSGVIVNADVSASAAIAGTKISPDFGAQNVTTTGTSTAASFIPSSATVPTNGLYLPAVNSVGISTNGTGRLFVDASGRVGIGTSTPERSLGVFTSTNDDGIQVRNTSTAASTSKNIRIQFSGTDTSGTAKGTANIYCLAADQDFVGAHLSFWTRGSDVNSERMRITSAGLVGIGVSAPTTKLQINAQDGFRFDVGANAYSYMQFGSAFSGEGTGEIGFERISGKLYLKNGSNPSLSTRITIDNNGLVGIGTSAPSSLLTVSGTSSVINLDVTGRVQASSSPNWNFAGLHIKRTASNIAAAKHIAFLLDGDSESDTTLTNYLNIWGTYSGTPTASSTSTGLSASMNLGAPNAIIAHTNGSERLRITSAGLVGIGTSAPSVLLHAAGTVRVGANDATDAVLEIGAGATGNRNAYIDLTGDTTYSDYGLRIFRDGTGANALSYLQHRGTGEFRLITNEAAPIVFWTQSGEKARLDSSGRLLVGTSTDSGGALLQVNGDRIRVGTAKTPASATDTGTAGEICWDASYIYVCTAANTWKRAALSTW